VRVTRKWRSLGRGSKNNLQESKRLVVVNVDQLARDGPPPELVCRRQAWKGNYPWLDRACQEAGPGALAASDSWRVRIEDELKTTLDFRVRPDGTAAVWCGMSGYDFHHDPTAKELFQGLAEAYHRELKRRRRQPSYPREQVEDERRHTPGSPKPQAPPVRAFPPPAADSLARILGAILLPRVTELVLIFLAVTTLTLVLSAVAIAAR
jgi:hypothetical protein